MPDSPCLVCGRETDCTGCRAHGTNSEQYAARKRLALAAVAREHRRNGRSHHRGMLIDRAIDCGATQDEIERVVKHR